MFDALNSQDRAILYSLCNWGNAAVNTWGAEVGNSWRMSGDISPGRGEVGPDRTRIAVWERIAEIANEMSFLVREYAGFWGWPDADMLEVGNGEGGMTVAENRAHFALWAAMRSPLLIGTKVSLYILYCSYFSVQAWLCSACYDCLALVCPNFAMSGRPSSMHRIIK